MRLHARRKSQAFRQFFRDDLLRVIAHHHMNLVCGGIEIIEQSLCVKRTAGSGDGDKDFQSMISVRG